MPQIYIVVFMFILVGYSFGQNNTVLQTNAVSPGQKNILIGVGSGNVLNPTSTSNVIVGFEAGYVGTTLTSSVFIGDSSGYFTTKNGNTFIGSRSGTFNTTGVDNVYLGKETGYTGTTSKENVYVGKDAGRLNVVGNRNVFLGFEAGENTTSGNNTFIGGQSGRRNTSGSNNTFVGHESGEDNTTGGDNTFLGRESGIKNTSGNSNTFVGGKSGQANLTGIYNTFIGQESGERTTSGGLNTFLGKSSGSRNTTGLGNSTLGVRSSYSNITGNYNVAVGDSAGFRNKSSNGVFVGTYAGFNSVNGSGNVFLGHLTDVVSDSTVTNVVAIGNNAKVAISNAIILGDTANPNIKIGIGTASPAHKLDVKGVVNMRVALGNPALKINGEHFVSLDADGGHLIHNAKIKYSNKELWSDKVFDKNYPLLSINDLDKYIKINKHLPNIPNEKEVTEKGVDLNSILSKLLEKIEEQALYIIDLQKQINDLKK